MVAPLFEALLPVRFAPDEDRNAVHQAYLRLENLLDVPFGGCLGADRQVVNHHVGAGVVEDMHDVGGRGLGLRNHAREVFAQTIVRHAAIDLRVQVRHVGKLIGVVGGSEDGLADIFPHLILINIDSG